MRKRTNGRAAAIADEFPNRCVDTIPEKRERDSVQRRYQTDFGCAAAAAACFLGESEGMRSNLGREAELNIRKWAWPTDRRKEREGRRGEKEEGAKITVPGANERATRDASFHDAGWLRRAVPPSTSLCLSVRPSPSRRVLGKRELCFRDTDVSRRIKAYERQLNE